jgi:hypothetical protein
VPGLCGGQEAEAAGTRKEIFGWLAELVRLSEDSPNLACMIQKSLPLTPKTYRELNWAGVEYKSLHEGEQAVLDHLRHRPT